jgi:predicted alpha-1,2-mannosidase
MAKDWGGLPRWPLAIGEGGSMIGTSADIVFGDAELAGGSPVTAAEIWPAVKDTAFGKHPLGKTDKDRIEPYMALGYVPVESGNGSVSHTLEYATADACGAVLAKAAGDEASAASLAARAGTWKNHLDAERGFLAPKREDGTIPKYSVPEHSTDYIEGSAWQYTFMVPQDVPGLVTAIGKTRFLEHLFGLMEGTRTDFQPLLPTGSYWHGNEPNLLAPFLFGHAGRADLGSWWVHWVADNLYTLEPGGLAGNDDGGTLSAWYVLAAAGIYPLSCTGEFTLTAPLFDEVWWNLPAGFGRPARTLRFWVWDILSEEPVTLPQWNSTPIMGPTVPVSWLMEGGTLTHDYPPVGGEPPSL